MKEFIIKKYENLIKSLEWHQEHNRDYIKAPEGLVIKARIEAYREIIVDIKMLET